MLLQGARPCSAKEAMLAASCRARVFQVKASTASRKASVTLQKRKSNKLSFWNEKSSKRNKHVFVALGFVASTCDTFCNSSGIDRSQVMNKTNNCQKGITKNETKHTIVLALLCVFLGFLSKERKPHAVTGRFKAPIPCVCSCFEYVVSVDCRQLARPA